MCVCVCVCVYMCVCSSRFDLEDVNICFMHENVCGNELRPNINIAIDSNMTNNSYMYATLVFKLDYYVFLKMFM